MYRYFVSYASIGEDNSIGFGNCFMNLDSKIMTPETIKEMNAWISKDASFVMPRRAVVLNFILVEENNGS